MRPKVRSTLNLSKRIGGSDKASHLPLCIKVCMILHGRFFKAPTLNADEKVGVLIDKRYPTGNSMVL